MTRRVLRQQPAAGFNQSGVEPIVLVGARSNCPGAQGVVKPKAVEQPALEHHAEHVAVAFQHLGRAAAIIGKVEAGAEGPLAAPPGIADRVPPRLRNLERGEDLIIGGGALDDRQAHSDQFRGRGLDMALDLVGGEGVESAIDPIRSADRGVRAKARPLRQFAPVRPGCDGKPPHGATPQPKSAGVNLSPSMPKPPRRRVMLRSVASPSVDTDRSQAG